MLAKVCAAAVQGIEAYPVEVEVNVGWGDTNVVIVGLPDVAVKESRDRVSTAMTNSAFKFPMGRTTINLAPADVKKEGPSFDLPIAVGMIAASEQMESAVLGHYAMVGELALTGAVRPVRGVLPIALRAKADGLRGVLVPKDNAPEAAVVAGLDVIPIQNLREAVGFLEGELNLAPAKVDLEKIFECVPDDYVDMADVKGQESVKRALEIGAAGGHNLLLLSTLAPSLTKGAEAPRAGSFGPLGSWKFKRTRQAPLGGPSTHNRKTALRLPGRLAETPVTPESGEPRGAGQSPSCGLFRPVKTSSSGFLMRES